MYVDFLCSQKKNSFYNIKNIARGGEKHEDGGFEINNLEKEDVIFPTQNNEQEFNRVLGAINRWKLKRDPRAKKLLDRTRDRLPTDEDYGYDKKFDKGKGKGKAYGQYVAKTNDIVRQREAFEKKYPGIDYDKFLKDNEKKIIERGKNGESFEQFADQMLSDNPDFMTTSLDGRSYQDILAEQNGNKVDPYAGMTQLDRDEAMLNDQMSDAEKAKNDEPELTIPYSKNIPSAMGPKDKGNSFNRYNMDNNRNIVDARGNPVINNDAKGTGISKEELEDEKRKASLKQQYKDSIKQNKIDGPYLNEEEEQQKKKVKTAGSNQNQYILSNNTAEESFELDEDEDIDQIEEYPFTKRDPNKIGERYGGEYYTKEDGTKVYTKDLMDAEMQSRQGEGGGEKTDPWDEITKIDRYTNPGKYASMINKSIQGSKPIEGVERRFSNSDKYKYEDMSAKDRQTNVEQRNYQNLSMRGKGLTAGQIQSYGAQNAARYYGNSEGINQRENQKRYEIANANVDLGNRDKQSNMALANQYDAIERQQRGVQQKYKDASYSDFSKLAQLDEQQRYMMNKDRKSYLRDKATLPFLGTRNMKVGPDGIRYIKDENGEFQEVGK